MVMVFGPCMIEQIVKRENKKIKYYDSECLGWESARSWWGRNRGGGIALILGADGEMGDDLYWLLWVEGWERWLCKGIVLSCRIPVEYQLGQNLCGVMLQCFGAN